MIVTSAQDASDDFGDANPNSSTHSREAHSSENPGDYSHGLRVLVGRAQLGDDQAWEMLFRRSYPRMLAYGLRRLPNPEQAKDAVAETLSRAVANIGTVRLQGGGFDAWMYGIMRHVVLDMQRGMWRERPGAIPDVVDGALEPPDRSIEGEDADELRRAFTQLRPSEQEILELRVVAGLSADDVATVLNRRPGAVRMAQSRALTRLRALIEEGRGRGHP